METRTLRVLHPDDIARIADTYHAWRGKSPTVPYEDVPGFSKAASLEEITDDNFALIPGRYVGVPDAAADDEPTEERDCLIFGLRREAL